MSTAPSQQLTLFRGWPDRTTYVWSPFVTKVEFRFRHAGLRYTAEAGSPRSAPKGKIPYVDLSALNTSAEKQDGSSHMLGDSTLIIDKLVQGGQLPDLHESLNERDLALDTALQALLEDKLYFYNASTRTACSRHGI